MNPINHYEGFEPRIITQHNYTFAACIDFHGWQFKPRLDDCVVAIFRITYKS